MKEVIGYIRVSTRKQLEDRTHTIQIEQIKRFCNYKKYKIVKIYQDLAVSGKKKERNELDKLKLFLENHPGQIHAIIITRLDRITRNLRHLFDLMDYFKEYKTSLIITEQSIDTTDNSAISRTFIQLLGIFAELEHTLIIERLQEGRNKALEFGTKSGLSPNRPKLELDLVEIKEFYQASASISSIARRYNVSRATIYNRLEEMGLK